MNTPDSFLNTRRSLRFLALIALLCVAFGGAASGITVLAPTFNVLATSGAYSYGSFGIVASPLPAGTGLVHGSASVDFGDEPAGATSDIATFTLRNTGLGFTGGLLTGPVSLNANATAASGLVTGGFAHADTTKTAYQGVILQKGKARGAYGWFLSTKPATVDYTGQGGAMIIPAK